MRRAVCRGQSILAVVGDFRGTDRSRSSKHLHPQGALGRTLQRYTVCTVYRVTLNVYGDDPRRTQLFGALNMRIRRSLMLVRFVSAESFLRRLLAVNSSPDAFLDNNYRPDVTCVCVFLS